MIGRAIGLVMLCFLVGLLLATFGVTARGIFTDTWNTILHVLRLIEDFVRWAAPYVALGAVVVVPLLLLGLFQRLGRRRR